MNELKVNGMTYVLTNNNACVSQSFTCVEQTEDLCVLRMKMKFEKNSHYHF